jgi:hypothetical protein
MGKTKTAFVSGVAEDAGLSGEEKYKLRARKKADAQVDTENAKKKQKASDNKGQNCGLKRRTTNSRDSPGRG